MKKIAIGLAIVVLVVLLAAQLKRVERTNPPVGFEIPAPPEVRAVLEQSCYDCHSNRTDWPWYSRVAPTSWFVADHVHDAREHMNLTQWPVVDEEGQRYYLAEMKRQIETREMPLRSYLLLHWGARLDREERALLLDWIDGELELLNEL